MSEQDTDKRCGWAMQSVLEQQYHDTEWGLPCTDEQRLFEFLVLESAQAGLSWRTVLQKREGYRRHYAEFDPQRVAAFGPAEVERMLADPGVIRHRGKIEASINAARLFLQIQQEFSSFARYLWAFVDNQPLQNQWQSLAEVPAETVESRALSADLRRRGLRFFGPTIAYAYMQSMGLVNDHLPSCPCHQACRSAAEQLKL